MSRKRMKKKRLSKNATPQIQSFKDKFSEILNDGEDIIFQDESHYSNDILPLYGYSERNVPCYITAATERSAFTLNFAFSKSGQIFYKIYKGSSCESRMQWFVDHLPRVRILFDNHSTHKCINVDVERIYTPHILMRILLNACSAKSKKHLDTSTTTIEIWMLRPNLRWQ